MLTGLAAALAAAVAVAPAAFTATIAVGPQLPVPSWACFWTGPGQPAVTGPRPPPELVAPGRQLAGGAADDGGVSKLTAVVSGR